MANKEKEVLEPSRKWKSRPQQGPLYIQYDVYHQKDRKEQVVLNLRRSRDPQILLGRMCNVRGVEQPAVPSITPLRTLRRNELTCLHRNVPTDVHSSMSHSSAII